MVQVDKTLFRWYLSQIKATEETHANVLNYVNAAGVIVAQVFDGQRYYIRR